MNFLPPELDHYCRDHSGSESDLLHDLFRETFQKVLQPRMLSGRFQGRFLSMISKMISPSYILEIGTYTGYSALCLAEGLKPGGKLVTIDKNEELEDIVMKYVGKAGLSDRVEMKIGNALEIIPGLDGSPDLVFLDADKINYLNYYELLIPIVKSGSYILADNVLWSGKVVEPVNPKDKDTIELLKFNRFVQDDDRVENVLLPIRDGLTLIRKK
ncbi:MAG: class I SAM-dependent methyltransferase [Bacteroidota bacterium]